MKTALVISGGGCKGAFAVGAIEVMRQRGIEFDLIAGTSTGSLIAPLVAIDDIDELVRIYTSVRTKNIIRGNWRKLYYNARYDTKPLERLIRSTMMGSGARFERLQMAATEIYLCSVGLYSRSVGYWTQRETPANAGLAVSVWGNFDDFVKAILASTNQPFLMPPIWLDGEPRIDGGVREIAPLRIARDLGATEIYVVANSPETEATRLFPIRIDRVGIQSLGMMTTEILNNDLVAGDGEEVTVIRPHEELTDNDLEFDPDKMLQMLHIGQRRAVEVLG